MTPQQRATFTTALLVAALHLAGCAEAGQAVAKTKQIFRAGAFAIDITPKQFPVIVNGGMSERLATKVTDPLHARCLVLDDGSAPVVIALVDNCLIPRSILDEAKDWDLSALPESGAGSIAWYTAPQNDITGTGLGAGGNGIAPISYPDYLEEGTGPAAVTRWLGEVPATGDIDLDVTELVKWMLGQQAAYSTFADTDGGITLCLRDVNIHGYHYTDYYSKEYTATDDDDAPRLVVTQVPEPATVALICLGAVVALGRRRSRTR